jgi:hypothetical protein
MTKLLHLFATLSLVLACGIASAAQTNHQESTSPNGTPAELSILIGPRQVKFTPLRQAQELRLEVFNNAGELLYDSGSLTEAELNWNLHDGYGNPLAPGLYAYTLSLKVPEAEAPRQHQGHLIIEKGHDQIWLTIKGAGRLGAEVTGGELTIARHSEGATGGAGYLASGRTLGERAGIQRDAQARTVADDKATGAEKDLRLAPNISGSGTTNRVTKWTDGPNGVVGDSVISEVGGNVGIGTNSPQSGLDYRNSLAPFFTRDIGVTNFGTAQSALQLGVTNLGSRNAGVGPSFLFFADNSAGNKSFLGRVSGVWENPMAGSESGALFFQVRANSGDVSALTERMRITASGNVGINTATPNARLEVVKSSASEDATVTATAYGDDNAVIGRSANGTASAPSATSTGRSLLFLGGRGHTGSAFTFSRAGINIAAAENWTGANNGTRISFDTTANGSTTRVERMRINHNGNVGIGTTSPDAPLEVVSDSGNGSLFTTTFGADNVVIGRSAGGTGAAPTATTNGQSLLLLGGRGHNGTGFTLTRAAMNLAASENWTNTATGSRISFSTSANGTIVSTERMRIDHNGRVGIGTTTPATTLDVAGIISAVTQYNLGGSRMLSTPGTTNLFVGVNAGNVSLTGFSNAAFGEEAGQSIADGDRNSFFGRSAGQFTSGGNQNSFFGHTAGRANDLGDDNTFFGYQAGLNNDFGNSNAFFGTGTGLTNTTGNNNTLIGASANVNSNNLNFATAIGAGAVVTNGNQVQVGRSGVDTVRVGFLAPAADNHVCYDILFTLSTCSSSRRYKENIQPLRSGLKLIQQMRPVTFDWIGRRAPSLGLIAEEVAAVEPRLVTHNSTGVIEGVKYDQMTAVLIQAVKEQQAQIAAQQAQIAAQQRQLGRLKKLVCRKQPQAGLCK